MAFVGIFHLALLPWLWPDSECGREEMEGRCVERVHCCGACVSGQVCSLQWRDLLIHGGRWQMKKRHYVYECVCVSLWCVCVCVFRCVSRLSGQILVCKWGLGVKSCEHVDGLGVLYPCCLRACSRMMKANV